MISAAFSLSTMVWAAKSGARTVSEGAFEHQRQTGTKSQWYKHLALPIELKMQNIAIMLALLLLPYWALLPTHFPESVLGRIGVSLVFAFTALGHFIKTSQV